MTRPLPSTLSRRTFLLAAAAGAVSALTTGCAGGAASTLAPPVAQLRGGSLAREVDLTGARLVVGSKEFTEQKILGRILEYGLQACGATTVDRTGLSGSSIVRQALQSGAIDVYWEYAGTGWTLFLRNEETVPGERALFDAVARQDLQRNGIVWMGPASFGNQYAVARRSDAEGALAGVTSMTQWSEYFGADPSRATFCGAAEFMDREFEDMQRAYDAYFPASQTYQNDFALNFVNVARSSPCDFAEVTTTDARIRSLDLTVLSDERNFFSTQLAGLTARAQTVQQFPALRAFAQKLGPALTVDTMIELNGQVDLQGASESATALRFLAEKGFIGA